MTPELQLDPASVAWLDELRADGLRREAAVARLHALLLRVAGAEARRRWAMLPERTRQEADDLCAQAAADASLGVLAKLDSYRGAARFTTWASKFAIFEISVRLRRHAWRDRKSESDDTVWDRLCDPRPGALEQVESTELLAAIRHAVAHDLTPRQRDVLTAATFNDVPIDALAERLGSTRGAVYKTLHDARRRLRHALVGAGHGEAMG